MTHPAVGQIRSFVAEPYHSGTMKITKVEELDEVKLYPSGGHTKRYRVTGTVVEGKTRNRLFSEVSYTDLSGSEMVLYSIHERDLLDETKLLRYVYPV